MRVMKFGQLPNGLSWLVDAPHIRGLGISSVQLLIPVGAVREKPAERGISHFIEHLMFHTKGPLGSSRLREAYNIFGSINAYTNNDHTVYFISVPDARLREAIQLLIKIVFQSHITQSDIEDERNVVLEEYKTGHNSGASVMEDVFSEVFKGHPLGNRLIGGATYINRYTLARIRGYLRDWYVPHLAKLAICTELSVNTAVSYISECFDGGCGRLNVTRQGLGEGIAAAPIPPFVIRGGGGGPRIRYYKGKQTALCISFPIANPGADIRRSQVYRMLSYILGNSDMSELFIKLRLESNLVYSIRTSYGESQGVGILNTFCFVNPENITKVLDQTLAVLKAPLNPERFKIYKKNFLVQLKQTFAADAAAWVEVLMQRWFNSGEVPIRYKDYVNLIKSINFGEVEAARREGLVFDGRMVIGIKGPHAVQKYSVQSE